MVGGTLAAAVGMSCSTRSGRRQLRPHVLPAELVISLGMGLAFIPLSSTALVGVEDHDAGVASALVNTSQQVGGSFGTALLNTIAASATTATSPTTAWARRPRAGHGDTVAFNWGSGALILAAVLSLVLVTKQRPPDPVEGDETPFEHAEELVHV